LILAASAAARFEQYAGDDAQFERQLIPEDLANKQIAADNDVG